MSLDPVEIKLNSGDSIKFSGRLKDSIFSKKLLPLSFPPEWELGVDDPVSHYTDAYNAYTLNSYNYRGPEFSSDIDVLAAGCSMTFGVGVPDNGTWPAIFSEKTGLSVANLSAPAASVEWIVDSIFRYIETFGRPNRAIIAYFPDLLRGEVLVDEQNTTASEWGPKDFHQVSLDEVSDAKLITHASLNMVSKDFPAPKIIKKPYPVEYTKTKEEAIRQSFAAIKNLEIFCKAAGIPLIWSSWSSDLHESMDGILQQYKFNSFWTMRKAGEWKSYKMPLKKTPEDPEGIADRLIDHRTDTLDLYGCSDEMQGRDECICFSDCHFDLADKYGPAFHMATDRFDSYKGTTQAHMGVHKLIHLAEAFIDMLDNLKEREIKNLLEEKMEEAQELDKELFLEFENEAQELAVKVVMREGQLRFKEHLITELNVELDAAKKENPDIEKEGQDWLDGVSWALHIIKELGYTI